MVMHVYACCRDDSTALRWLKPDMAIVVGDLGEEDEQLAQEMVQGLTEAQVAACLCWSTASSLTVLLVRVLEDDSAAPGSVEQLCSKSAGGAVCLG